LVRREISKEDQRMMDEWLAKGNKVTICPPCTRSDPDKVKNKYKMGWGGNKKKKEEDKDS
jgi:hypothetical protein